MKNKAVVLLAFSTFALHAGLVESLYSTPCSKYMKQDSHTMIQKNATKNQANIGPICMNLKYHMEEADNANGIRKFISMGNAQVELDKMQLFDVNMAVAHKSIKQVVQNAHNTLLTKGHIKPSERNIVVVDVDKESEDTYKMTRYHYSKNGIKTEVSIFEKADFIQMYPSLADDYNISIADKENLPQPIQSVSPKSREYNSTASIIMTGNNVNCRDFPTSKEGAIKKTFNMRTKLKAVVGNNGATIQCNGYLLVENNNGELCWVSQGYLGEQQGDSFYAID